MNDVYLFMNVHKESQENELLKTKGDQIQNLKTKKVVGRIKSGVE